MPLEARGTPMIDEAGAVELGEAAALAERGRAQVWPIVLRGQPAMAFALRVDGRVVAYVNRCAHVAAEMDWNLGEFLDAPREHIVCSLHGALYDPHSGRCAGGPCGRAALEALDVREGSDGRLRWYPSSDARAAIDAARRDPHSRTP